MKRDPQKKDKIIDINMKFNPENIYIFQNTTDKIFVIKNQFYIKENKQMKNIQNTDEVLKNFNYNDLITLYKKNTIQKKKVYKGKKNIKTFYF